MPARGLAMTWDFGRDDLMPSPFVRNQQPLRRGIRPPRYKLFTNVRRQSIESSLHPAFVLDQLHVFCFAISVFNQSCVDSFGWEVDGH